MKVKIIKHNKIRCKKCGEIIESFSRHDYKWCSCGNCAVDGGHDYLRRGWYSDEWEDLSEFEEIEVKPKYKIGDVVSFIFIPDYRPLKGKIVMVDTYPKSTTITYDIMLMNEEHLYKHVDEEDIVELLPNT